MSSFLGIVITSPQLTPPPMRMLTPPNPNEYFEWYVWRNKERKITKLAFVTETPEYYQRLWSTPSPTLSVNLYRTLVDPAVVQADLQNAGGAYNKFNRWNTVDGIVHYIQSINTLSAAFGLAQGSVTAAPPFQ